MKCFRMMAVIGMVLVSGAVFAQAPAPVASPPASLRVQVVLSRYQGEKKISSFPYTLSMTADDTRSELRMGSQIPVSALVQGTTTTSFKEVGTSINCSATARGSDSFRLVMWISDSSLYEETANMPTRPVGGLQPIRSFSSDNTLILKDGQTSQFTTATDRITGEVTKADVTLTVVK